MKNLFNEFVESLMEHKKEKCVQMVLDCLSSDEINVVDLYTEILTPALNNIPCHNREDQHCI
ncbi:hypothetical protein HYG86_14805 [Alkalicella caledoniensis]|uniref:Uncharacterized protein n=1 Tax=Alkalicella caledoniensis TaxID=2731377 RepID=A0A7G9WB82_ALKCA|nr:hypothetical protein [Alkalicella caledoniensis]QNO15944.1 hypothetical protein HYG86_14805 [Alkalicella caledoniensis]